MITFSQMLIKLQEYWSQQGCNIIQPYDIPAGAGTFHPMTLLRSLDSKPWSVAYVAPSRRPTDGRYGENPNRLGSYYQFQVIIKPNPADIQELYLKSLEYLGLNLKEHDIRFVEIGTVDISKYFSKEVLKELADKKVLESSIISYLSTLNTPKSTIKNLILSILHAIKSPT
jgi:hypothetical protein